MVKQTKFVRNFRRKFQPFTPFRPRLLSGRISHAVGSLARGDTRGGIRVMHMPQLQYYHCLSHLGKKYTLHFPIHRGVLIHDYFQIQIHEDELQSSILIDEIV